MNYASPHFDRPRPDPFSRWLTEWRIAKGLRQADLAARLGIHPGRISELETGQRRPTRELALALQRALGPDVPPPPLAP